jgi:glycerophosphoryl diester phosphodiesterase
MLVVAKIPAREESMSGSTLIIGHRGASRDAPENTLASFGLAFRQGADGVEADFRLTRDGQIVCLHDDSTRRTGDADLVVAESTLKELRRLDLGLWKGEKWRGERMPLLSEVLAALPAGKSLFIELKSGLEILSPLAATLAASGVEPSRLRLLAFDRELILAAKERLPEYRACWLTDYRFRGAWHPSREQLFATLRESRADGLASRDRSILDADLVGALRKKSLEIHVWTVDAAASGRRLCALGVDSIMTNRPGWLRQALSRQLAADTTSSQASAQQL